MKIVNEETYLTIGEIAQKIDRIPRTVKNWISWYETQSEEVKVRLPLPTPIVDLDRKGTRYFKEADLPVFEEFRDKIKRGTMSEYSVTLWGKRGKEIQKRKEDAK